MGPLSRIRNAAGLLALGASIALASPGVDVVRAAPGDTARVPAQAAPAQCGAARAAATPVDPQVNAFLAELRQQQARFPAAGVSDDGFVVLNNRGYNYGPANGIELDVIRAEARGR